MIVLEWLRENWKGLGYPLACLFAFLWWNKGCPQVVTPPVTTAQAQTSTQGSHLVIRYVDRPVAAGEAKPLPCPEIDFSTTEAHWQSQQVTQTAQNGTQEARNAIFLGGGYLAGPNVVLGLSSGNLRVYGQGWIGNYGAGLTYDCVKW